FYGPRLLLDLLPWSCLLPAACWWLVRRGRWREERAARFGLVWLAVILGLLCCMRFKRAGYLAPAFPGAALLLLCAAGRWYGTASHGRRWAVAFGVVLVSCLAGWLGYLERMAAADHSAWTYRRFAAEIRRRTSNTVIFFRAESHAVAFHVGRPMHTVLEW